MKKCFILSFSIDAPNYYGARHGIETLFQMVVWDEVREKYLMPDNVNITDNPTFTHRGMSLDTVRNFISIDTIKKVI